MSAIDFDGSGRLDFVGSRLLDRGPGGEPTCPNVDSIRFVGMRITGTNKADFLVRWHNTNIGQLIPTEIHRSIDGGATFQLIGSKNSFNGNGTYEDPRENPPPQTNSNPPPFDVAVQYKVKPLNCGTLFSAIITTCIIPSEVFVSGFPDPMTPTQFLDGSAFSSNVAVWGGLIGTMVNPDLFFDDLSHDIWGIVMGGDPFGQNPKWNLQIWGDHPDSFRGVLLFNGYLDMVRDQSSFPVQACQGIYQGSDAGIGSTFEVTG